MSEFTEKVANMLTKARELEGSKELITIPKEAYDRLLADQEFLSCLEAAGVDNWSGYDEAVEMYNEDDGEDE
jgi:hypothetical protein